MGESRYVGEHAGLAMAVEGEQWLVTLVGMLGERPSPDIDGFAAYARSLWAPDLHEVITAAEPVSEAETGAFPAYRRYRYDRLPRRPEGYAVLGDAVCSFNPVHSLGMSVAIAQARALDEVLDRQGTAGAGHRLLRRTRRLVDDAWSLTTGADLAHPAVAGPRPLSWRVMNAYLNRLLPATGRDPALARAFFEVAALTAPPQRLLNPPLVTRVLASRRGRRHPTPAHPASTPTRSAQ